MKSLRSVFNVSGCLMLIIGVALLAIPAVYSYLSNRADGNSVEVTGTVIAMYTTTSWSSDQSRNVTYYCPTVEYSTVEGQTYIFDSINCSTPAAYQVGDTVEVYYPIDAPQEGKMKTNILRLLGTGTAWSFGALGVCLGIGGIAAFALGIFVGRKKEPAAV